MQKIAIIGAGKVGKSLALACQQAALSVQIYARNPPTENIFYTQTGLIIYPLAEISLDAHLYLICVADQAISQIAAQLSALNLPKVAIIAHTAGGQNLQKLSNLFPNAGVFYPLLTFSEGRRVDFQQLPFCINGTNRLVINYLRDLAQLLGKSENVHIVSEEARARLHVGAVFVNNFSNFLFATAQNFCQAERVDFHLLLPLLRETVDKIQANPLNISELQTGAAIRGDHDTIDKHKALLTKYPSWANLYQFLTEQIVAFYQK